MTGVYAAVQATAEVPLIDALIVHGKETTAFTEKCVAAEAEIATIIIVVTNAGRHAIFLLACINGSP